MAAGGSVDPVALEHRRRASAKVVGSGTVGPEAITEGSSPGTSLMRYVTTRAGWAAAARRPPFTAERCLRTQFISAIVAPLRSRAAFTARLSSSETPSAGSASSAEPPPEMRQMSRSSAVEAAGQLEDAAGRRAAGRVRHRVRGLDDLDALAGHGVAVAA